jgi:hypothetical protein
MILLEDNIYIIIMELLNNIVISDYNKLQQIKEIYKKQQADEQQADEQQADEQQAVEQQADEQQADEQQAVEQQADEQQADEQQAVEQQADEQQAVEQQVVLPYLQQTLPPREERKKYLSTITDEIKTIGTYHNNYKNNIRPNIEIGPNIKILQHTYYSIITLNPKNIKKWFLKISTENYKKYNFQNNYWDCWIHSFFQSYFFIFIEIIKNFQLYKLEELKNIYQKLNPPNQLDVDINMTLLFFMCYIVNEYIINDMRQITSDILKLFNFSGSCNQEDPLDFFNYMKLLNIFPIRNKNLIIGYYDNEFCVDDIDEKQLIELIKSSGNDLLINSIITEKNEINLNIENINRLLQNDEFTEYGELLKTINNFIQKRLHKSPEGINPKLCDKNISGFFESTNSIFSNEDLFISFLPNQKIIVNKYIYFNTTKPIHQSIVEYLQFINLPECIDNDNYVDENGEKVILQVHSIIFKRGGIMGGHYSALRRQGDNYYYFDDANGTQTSTKLHDIKPIPNVYGVWYQVK